MVANEHSASGFPDIWSTRMTTGDNGSGATSDSLMAVTGEVPNLTLLSDVIGATGAAAERLPEALSGGLAGALLLGAQSSTT